MIPPSRTNYERELAEMPVGLDRAILRVLSYRRGRARAIGRMGLVAEVQRLGIRATERQTREAIKGLRRSGHMICAAAGEGGGYYLAESLVEYREFRQSELAAKISDLSETMRAMDASAEREWGDVVQPGLF